MIAAASFGNGARARMSLRQLKFTLLIAVAG
jgi:hypothetical protein